MGEELGVPKPSGVCPEPTSKADHPPEGLSGEKNPMLFIKKRHSFGFDSFLMMLVSIFSLRLLKCLRNFSSFGTPVLKLVWCVL